MPSNTVDIDGNERDGAGDEPWARQVLRAVKEMRYGSVEIVVHDGRVVQIERRVKVRFGADRRLPDHR